MVGFSSVFAAFLTMAQIPNMIANGITNLTDNKFLILLIIPVGLVCWLFPLLGRFEFSLPDLFLTAFRLMLAHIPPTLVLVILAVLFVSLSSWLFVLMLLTPALWAVCASWLLERAFAKHMSPSDEDGA